MEAWEASPDGDGRVLLPISLMTALTLYAVSFVVGDLNVFVLDREPKGQSLMETVEV